MDLCRFIHREGKAAVAPKIRIGNNHLHLPRSRVVRVTIGLLLIAGGLVGFLPVLGFWMIPLGVLVLSIDVPMLRRWRQRFKAWRARKRAAREGRNPRKKSVDEASDHGR